jgi:hypothetical protein
MLPYIPYKYQNNQLEIRTGPTVVTLEGIDPEGMQTIRRLFTVARGSCTMKQAGGTCRLEIWDSTLTITFELGGFTAACPYRLHTLWFVETK